VIPAIILAGISKAITMVLEYKIPKFANELGALVEGYMNWYFVLMGSLFYPKNTPKTIDNLLSTPPSILTWAAEAKKSRVAGEEEITMLIKQQNEIVSKASSLRAHAIETHAVPPYDKFQAFSLQFQNFISHLARVEDRILQKEHAIDHKTGLRSFAMFESDLKREMELVKRNGQSFVLCVLKIAQKDGGSFPDREKLIDYMKRVAHVIASTLRAYDDAYAWEDDKFIIVLKQSSKAIGNGVISRVHDLTETNSDVKEWVETNKIEPVLLSCMAEPVPGENVQDLLDNLLEELDLYKTDGNLVLEHKETSPLEKYVQSQQ
jgi:GGDEF domain-containing protein